MDKILVVDLGGQYAHLIANRVRRLGVLADISTPESVDSGILDKSIKGLIFSGGPQSVYENDSPTVSNDILDYGLPILGICYGHQLIAYKLGGKVSKGKVKEYGLAEISLKIDEETVLFDGLANKQIVWMSHGDSVSNVPTGFKILASSDDCLVAAMSDIKRNIYGVQFHPEVTHTVNGMKILENFVLKICGCKKDWDPKKYLDAISKDILRLANSKKVFLLVSGGVDSVVLFTLLNKILGKDKVFGIHVDTGLMRFNESIEVEKALRNLGYDNLKVVDASKQYLKALQGVVNPEDKRKIIGNLFIDIIGQYSDDILSSDNWIVCQGTIYPDTIESKGTKNADLIKTHHNRVPKMQVLISQGRVMEPFSHLYKDEVRLIGKMLGLSDEIVNRHPFPGPGLGVRILCNDKDVNISELKLLQNDVSAVNSAALVLPIKSVGVQGDKRTYKYPAVIEIKNIRDNNILNWDLLEKQSTELTNKVAGINRVMLLIAKKDGEYALKKEVITPERVKLLQKADNIVNNIILKAKLYDSIWQMPIVLVPLSIDSGESIILRPVDSQEAMTARFSRIPIKIVLEICDALMAIDGIDAVFYDITNKPPGTIEWE